MSELENKHLPAVFINRFRKKNMVECQTLELVKLNQKITDAHNEVINMSDRSVQELINDVRSEIHPLFKISESIAMLDMIASFAQLVTTQDYVKPELTDTLAIKAGRHPIRDKIHIEKYVPNDVYATQQTRFQIITGCNMSGKSTYIRAIALMTVIAQVGCFVPAQYASFPISHQLFARVSTDDNIEANVSTFAAEMREIAFILRNIERRSLVIIDELGRGTSTTDGLAIAIAIAEALIESRAYVWFVTHFRDLARILAERAGVINLHLAVDISVSSSKMKMLYKVADGLEEEKFYGLALARVLDLPEEVIKTAKKVSEALNRRNEARKSNAQVLSIARRRKLVLSLREQLIQAKKGSMEGEELLQWLKRLQDEFVVRMQAIEAEAATAVVKELEDATESDRSFESCASADQADQLSADHGMDFGSVSVDTCLSFPTPKRPIKMERQSSVIASVDERHSSMVDSRAGRQHSIVESIAGSEAL
jgi:DNA mismatch repair protein MSH4